MHSGESAGPSSKDQVAPRCGLPQRCWGCQGHNGSAGHSGFHPEELQLTAGYGLQSCCIPAAGTLCNWVSHSSGALPCVTQDVKANTV